MQLRVTQIRYEAETIRSIELRDPSGAALPPYTAGAHLDIALPGDLSRSYSLTGDPGEADRYTIAVHREPASRGGSAWLVETLRVGDMLTVSAPRNTFPLAETDGTQVFFAGGIGITPILAMIRDCAASGADWRLVYAFRSRAHAAFLPELTALAGDTPERLHLHDDSVAGGVLPMSTLAAACGAGDHLYCCGPKPMIDAFLDAAQGRDDEHVHVEHFSGTVTASTEAFTVVLKRKGLEFEIPPGRTIMEVLRENGVRVAYSCQEGVCGTCETRVVEGIPDHKDNVLSKRERESNKVMMICCSGAKSDRLVLDI